MANECPRCKSLNTTYRDEEHTLSCLYCGYRPTRALTPVDAIPDSYSLIPKGKFTR